jgi:hypothetical protein
MPKLDKIRSILRKDSKESFAFQINIETKWDCAENIKLFFQDPFDADNNKHGFRLKDGSGTKFEPTIELGRCQHCIVWLICEDGKYYAQAKVIS